MFGFGKYSFRVSTHSRPKAAGLAGQGRQSRCCRFNTQPPEGGWLFAARNAPQSAQFQHTAARRRLAAAVIGSFSVSQFQHTAARRRLVAATHCQKRNSKVSTHSRPKAAGLVLGWIGVVFVVSTHSRPKAAGVCSYPNQPHQPVSTHSRPKAAGPVIGDSVVANFEFQHTAARRRLDGG